MKKLAKEQTDFANGVKMWLIIILIIFAAGALQIVFNCSPDKF
jgi:hypothetical protein